MSEQLMAKAEQMHRNLIEAELYMDKIEAEQEGNKFFKTEEEQGMGKIEAGRGQGAGHRQQGADCALLARAEQMRGDFLEAKLDMGKIKAEQEGDNFLNIEVRRGQGTAQRRQAADCSLLAMAGQMHGDFLKAELNMGKIEAEQEVNEIFKIEAGRGQGAGQRRQGAKPGGARCMSWSSSTPRPRTRSGGRGETSWS